MRSLQVIAFCLECHVKWGILNTAYGTTKQSDKVPTQHATTICNSNEQDRIDCNIRGMIYTREYLVDNCARIPSNSWTHADYFKRENTPG